jgi:hypothetical protein
MPKGPLFWMLFILSVIFGLYWGYSYWGWGAFGGSVIVFVLIGLVGWRVFGPPIQG